MKTIALDVYGTLIDLNGMLTTLDKMVNEKAGELMSVWRTKQLEYSFRRGLMEDYVSFSQITHEALQYSLMSLGVSLLAPQERELLEAYNRLPAFPDVLPCLRKLKAAGLQVIAFSNGDYHDVLQVLTNADLIYFIDDIVSVESVRTFKPSPTVYKHFEKISGCKPEDIILVSSNPFDLAGAANLGWITIWIKRKNDIVFDSWGEYSSSTVANFKDVIKYTS